MPALSSGRLSQSLRRRVQGCLLSGAGQLSLGSSCMLSGLPSPFYKQTMFTFNSNKLATLITLTALILTIVASVITLLTTRHAYEDINNNCNKLNELRGLSWWTGCLRASWAAFSSPQGKHNPYHPYHHFHHNHPTKPYSSNKFNNVVTRSTETSNSIEISKVVVSEIAFGILY
jgi:hypothetical protein